MDQDPVSSFRRPIASGLRPINRRATGPRRPRAGPGKGRRVAWPARPARPGDGSSPRRRASGVEARSGAGPRRGRGVIGGVGRVPPGSRTRAIVRTKGKGHRPAGGTARSGRSRRSQGHRNGSPSGVLDEMTASIARPPIGGRLPSRRKTTPGLRSGFDRRPGVIGEILRDPPRSGQTETRSWASSSTSERRSERDLSRVSPMAVT